MVPISKSIWIRNYLLKRQTYTDMPGQDKENLWTSQVGLLAHEQL
jgi:hypothetical protein